MWFYLERTQVRLFEGTRETVVDKIIVLLLDRDVRFSVAGMQVDPNRST